MARYRSEERENIINSRLIGETLQQLSKRSGVSATTLGKWVMQKKIHEAPKLSRLFVGQTDESFSMIRVHKEGVFIELPVDVDAHYVRSMLGW